MSAIIQHDFPASYPIRPTIVYSLDSFSINHEPRYCDKIHRASPYSSYDPVGRISAVRPKYLKDSDCYCGCGCNRMQRDEDRPGIQHRISNVYVSTTRYHAEKKMQSRPFASSAPAIGRAHMQRAM